MSASYPRSRHRGLSEHVPKCQWATSLSVNTERKTTVGPVGIGGHRAPNHLVDPHVQGLEAHTDCVVVDLRVALTDFNTVSVHHR